MNLAPNGKPSNLNAEQYALVRTPEFKAWFGDWENTPENASKVVDENGEPLVCYHGSRENFSIFEKKYIGSTNDRGFYGSGFYFTFQKIGENRNYAINEAAYYGSNITNSFIKALNPFDFSRLSLYKGYDINYLGSESIVFLSNLAKMFPILGEVIKIDKNIYNSDKNEYDNERVPISILPELIEKYSKELVTYITDNNWGERIVKSGYVKNEIVEYIKSDGSKASYESFDSLGRIEFRIKDGIQYPSNEEIEILLICDAIKKYDGIDSNYHPEGYMTRYVEITDSIKEKHDCIMQNESGDELVVFESNQIKLADGSNTTFDSNNPDIRYAKGGAVDSRFEENRKEIERQLDEKNIDYSFSSHAITNFGTSIYYRIGGLDGEKWRFSDHSVSNINRLQDERHFPLPIRYSIGIGGISKKTINDNILKDMKYADGGLVKSVMQRVLNGEIDSDDAAIEINKSGMEVTYELYDELRDAEKKFRNKGRGLQVGDIVKVKGKNGNPDFEGNYRGAMPDGKLIVIPKSGMQIAVSKDEIISNYRHGGELGIDISEDEIKEWKESHKVDKKQVRNDKVREAAKLLSEGKIPQQEYLKIVRDSQPIKPFKEVPKIPSLLEIVGSLKNTQIEKGIIGYTKFIEDGEYVASRLDIPAYENYDVWVVSVHNGNKEGQSIGYGQTAYLENVNFLSSPKTALKIATGESAKSTIGRMFGSWVNKDPKEVREMAIKYMNSPDWVQVGMNPFRHSWFYDKSDGMPLLSASEVIQVGALVLAKNALKTTTDNPIFIADKNNPDIKFATGGELVKSNVYYHGSNILFKDISFMQKDTGESLRLGEGIYVTNDIEVSKKYGNYIYEIIIEEPLVSLNYSSEIPKDKFVQIITFFENSDDDDLNSLAMDYQQNLDDGEIIWGRYLISDLERYDIDVYKTLIDLGYNSIAQPINKLNSFIGWDNNSLNINVFKKGILHILSVKSANDKDINYADGGELVIKSKYTFNDIQNKYPTIPKDYLNKQLDKGINVELEHSDNPEVAQKIALDHLNESPYYYEYLKDMENQLENIDIKKHYKEISQNNTYMKKGGELNPDNSSVKNYFAHDSGNAGGVLVGQRHSEGGIKAMNKGTGQPIEMEGGEVVITRNAVSDNSKREFDGQMLTNKQILSKINESGGGVSFADGGDVPESIMVSGREYSYGGKTMKDSDIVSSCGCKHSMAEGGETNSRQAYYATLSNKCYEDGGELDTEDFNDTEKYVLNNLKLSIHGLIKLDRTHAHKLENIENKGLIYITQSDSHGCKDVKLTDYGIQVVRSMGDMQFKDGGSLECMECGCKEYKSGGTTDVDTKYYKGTKHEYDNQFQINKAIEELITDIEPKNLTPEEKQFISYYAGYGGLEKFGASGKGLLYEYFTPSEIAKKMWGLAYKHGFKGGRVLEPSCGIGEFIKYAPDQYLVTGYEINEFSAKICSILYPNATIESKYFETLFIKNNDSIRDKTKDLKKYSLVIGNPPYGTMGGIYAGLGEKSYTKANNYIDYFILRGLDLLESNGLLIYIIGTEVAAGGVPFLQQGMNAVKQNIALKADIVDAYRLPNGLFETTDVLTDIIVFKKK